MSTAPKPPNENPPEAPAEEDISDAEREALLKETLSSLQEAFSAPDEEGDAGTATELHQNPAETVPETEERPL